MEKCKFKLNQELLKDVVQATAKNKNDYTNHKLIKELTKKWLLDDVGETVTYLQINGYVYSKLLIKSDNIHFSQVELGVLTTKGETHFKVWVKNILKEQDMEEKLRLHSKFPLDKLKFKPNQGFYILPFSDECLDTMKTINYTLELKDIDCKLVKSQDIFDSSRDGDIIQDIWRDILESRFVVVDLSQKNPNVYYELGIVEAAGKSKILICSEDSIEKDYKGKYPFDISTEYIFEFNKAKSADFREICNKVCDRIQKILDSNDN